MHELATCYAVLNRHAEALRLREETLAAQRRVLPPDHPATLASMNNLAANYAALNRPVEAVKMLEAVRVAMKRVLPADHPNTFGATVNLADSYRDGGRVADAVRLCEEALPAMKATMPDHPFTFNCVVSLARSYAALNRHPEAIPLLDEVLAKADRPGVGPRLFRFAIGLRLRCSQQAGDAAGCRATAGRLEGRILTDAADLYTAACCRAVAASVQAQAPGGDAARLAREDADRAMTWLAKAVAAGWKDAGRMRADAALDALRGREDFTKLLADLEATPSGKNGPGPTPDKR
jgi:tetratricopeptide (TPR) repeat protein